MLVLYAHMLPCTSHVPQTTYTCETSILQSNRVWNWMLYSTNVSLHPLISLMSPVQCVADGLKKNAALYASEIGGTVYDFSLIFIKIAKILQNLKNATGKIHNFRFLKSKEIFLTTLYFIHYNMKLHLQRQLIHQSQSPPSICQTNTARLYSSKQPLWSRSNLKSQPGNF